jgi:uncharacterized protein
VIARGSKVPAVSFRVYGPLNDFLTPGRRQGTLVCSFEPGAPVKDLVEALGVPHVEIDRIAANGTLVGFDYVVGDGDRIAIYPSFDSFELGDAGRLSPPPQPEPRFVADVHLGRLAAFLRLAGFDTDYRNDYTDRELVEISATRDRTLLTRDVGVLKHRVVTRGCFVRETRPARQLVEVLRRFDLAPLAAPFSRCLRCNTRLQAVARDEIVHLLPPRTREYYSDFARCPGCGRVYWEGSHHAQMTRLLEAALAAARGRGGEDGTDAR